MFCDVNSRWKQIHGLTQRYISVNALATTENYIQHGSTRPAFDVIRFEHENFLYSGFFRHFEVGLVIFDIFSTLVHPPPPLFSSKFSTVFSTLATRVPKKSVENFDEKMGGGGALVSKIRRKSLDQPLHVEKTLVNEISMLKSNYVEAGREEPGRK